MDARPLRAERNLSELVLNAPEIINPLVGYHGECCCASQHHAAPLLTAYISKWQPCVPACLLAEVGRVAGMAPCACKQPRRCA